VKLFRGLKFTRSSTGSEAARRKGAGRWLWVDPQVSIGYYLHLIENGYMVQQGGRFAFAQPPEIKAWSSASGLEVAGATAVEAEEDRDEEQEEEEEAKQLGGSREAVLPEERAGAEEGAEHVPEAAIVEEAHAGEDTAAETANELRSKLGRDICIVCILGGTEFRGVDSEALVKAIASKLEASIGSKAKFLTGGMAGVQETFAKHCGDGSRVWNLLPVGQSSSYGRGTDINVGAGLEERKAVFGLIGDIYITVEGGPGVSQEAKAAHARGVLVVPLMRTGGASNGMFEFPQGALQKPDFSTDEQWSLLKRHDAPVDESAAAVAAVVEACIGATMERTAAC